LLERPSLTHLSVRRQPAGVARRPAVAGIHLGEAELWLALAAWAVVLAGMLRHVTLSVLLRPRARP
jgi:hypothetical protein